jgi:AcrR family transcriptional regulator
MSRRTSTGPTTQRFVEETLGLIAEKGGSRDVNLREVCRRVGCAHTNAYNYFGSFQDLLWATFGEGLDRYAQAIGAGLDQPLGPRDWYRQLITNLVEFAVHNPGLHRFLGSDPLPLDSIPDELLAAIDRLKGSFVTSIAALCGPRLDAREVQEMAAILLTYLDGETLNLINGRFLPGEDIVARVVDNAERLFTLLSATGSDGIDLAQRTDVFVPPAPGLGS